MIATSSTATPFNAMALSSRIARFGVAASGLLFVLVWSSGYIAGKIALLHGAAFTLLVLRFSGAAVIFAALAVLARAQWPGWRTGIHSAVVGLLSLALQFGGVYVGVQMGAEVGVAALVIGAMPLVTAALAPWIGEHVSARQWIGLVLGVGGVVLVLADRLGFGGASVGAYALLVLGLAGISIGTLYQKRFASTLDMRAGLAIQHAMAALVLLPFAIGEGFRFDGSSAFTSSLGWLIAVNSVGGFALLFALLRRGEANRVAQLFFLIPPVTAVLGLVLLSEQFSTIKLAGFAVAALGVYIGTRPARTKA
jgi:drug/metabolite transporter (DMT)-like permease